MKTSISILMAGICLLITWPAAAAVGGGGVIIPGGGGGGSGGVGTNFVAGTGIVVTKSGPTNTVAIDTAVVPQLGADNTFTGINTFTSLGSTPIDSSKLTGVVPVSNLSTNVALLNTNETFTGIITFKPIGLSSGFLTIGTNSTSNDNFVITNQGGASLNFSQNSLTISPGSSTNRIYMTPFSVGIDGPFYINGVPYSGSGSSYSFRVAYTNTDLGFVVTNGAVATAYIGTNNFGGGGIVNGGSYTNVNFYNARIIPAWTNRTGTTENLSTNFQFVTLSNASATVAFLPTNVPSNLLPYYLTISEQHTSGAVIVSNQTGTVDGVLKYWPLGAMGSHTNTLTLFTLDGNNWKF